jgi:hypothetical protein
VVGRTGGIAGSWGGDASWIIGEPGVSGRGGTNVGGEWDDGVDCGGGEGSKVADGEGVENRI